MTDLMNYLENFKDVNIDYEEGNEESDLKEFCSKVASTIESVMDQGDATSHPWNCLSSVLEKKKDWKDLVKQKTLAIFMEYEGSLDLDVDEDENPEEMRRMILASICIGASVNFLVDSE